MPSFYSPKLELAFAHNPRTGGTSIGLGAVHLDPNIKIWWDHKPIEQDIIDKCKFSFSIVRNPWDRCVSGYHFFKDGQLHPNMDRAIALRQEFLALNGMTEETFPSFDEVIKKLNNSNTFSIPKEIISIFFLTPQAEITKNVNYVARYENLSDELKYIEKLMNCRFIPHQDNVSKRDKNYQNYYTNETKNIIGELFYDDILKFNYSF